MIRGLVTPDVVAAVCHAIRTGLTRWAATDLFVGTDRSLTVKPNVVTVTRAGGYGLDSGGVYDVTRLVLRAYAPDVPTCAQLAQQTRSVLTGLGRGVYLSAQTELADVTVKGDVPQVEWTCELRVRRKRSGNG